MATGGYHAHVSPCGLGPIWRNKSVGIHLQYTRKKRRNYCGKGVNNSVIQVYPTSCVYNKKTHADSLRNASLLLREPITATMQPGRQLLFSLICCTLLLTACNKNIRRAQGSRPQPFFTPAPADNDNLLMGNPSKAAPDTASANNYLMQKPYYTLCYNRSTGKPNWVSWHINQDDLGSQSRANNFRADSALPISWYHVSDRSYVGSGFDRGHNCPSADRTATSAANSATFLMSNMMPQAPNNNQHTWANFENYIRSLVKAGNEVYVIMGSYGCTGTGSKGTLTAIDNGHVMVPSQIWKVVIVLPNGDHDLARINDSTRVIAVNTPNINTLNSDWTQYLTTVDAIEAATGYDLLSNVADSVQQVIEARTDAGK